jgi:hypothetical protein
MTTASTLRSSFLFLCAAAAFTAACATAEDGAATGALGSGGDSSSGGDFGSGGVSGSGSSSSSGGVFGVSGGAASGGAASGGAASGGAGTGGAPFTGQCAGKPALADWKNGSIMTGDEVVIRCTVLQSGCAGKMTGVDYLWQCNDSHVDNCKSQTPEGGSAWTFLGACTDTGMGGAGP